ncbi:hypothetical protein C1J01_48610 [Nonomuraea aridisoli]|uniref:Uncharacterized protein n=1 Tax=Nonomuraea aridisoli TaxID=2070368 RepID=A0A2W2CG72_9ACTN|nr:hypothetical protein C1J01_48610 [Nonomuraea aridisoli]
MVGVRGLGGGSVVFLAWVGLASAAVACLACVGFVGVRLRVFAGFPVSVIFGVTGVFREGVVVPRGELVLVGRDGGGQETVTLVWSAVAFASVASASGG